MRNLKNLVVGSLLLLGAVACASTAVQPAATIPGEMRAARVDTDSAPGTLKIVTVAVPKPAAGQVLIQVHAAGANPADWGIRTGPPRPLPPGVGNIANNSPGADVAGVVVAAGDGVSEYKIGDKVVAALQQSGGGAFAEYAVAYTDYVSHMPKKFSFEQAAGIPTAGFTALRMVTLGEVKKGERVLVIGAAGGVGSAAVQTAKARGAIVVSSASSRHADYLKKLGVDEIISYDRENVAEKARNIDVVINAVGSENAAAMTYVKRGGRVINIGGTTDPATCTAAGISCMMGGPGRGPAHGDMIKELVRMADAGQFTVIIDKTFTLDTINDAYAFGRTGNRQGKLAIKVAR